MVYDWLRKIQDWCYPPRCLLCGAAGHGSMDICSGCLQALPHNRHACASCALPLPVAAPSNSLCGNCMVTKPHFDCCYAALIYAHPVNSLITRLKFKHQLEIAGLLAQTLEQYLHGKDFARPDFILPIPLHPTRLKERGFNQAVEIARPLSRAFDLPLETRLCRRIRVTPSQRELSQRERRKNLRHAFSLHGSVSGARIALVDDVMTTGSTLDELARELARAGAQQVIAWCVARTP